MSLKLKRIFKYSILFIINTYSWLVSPLLGRNCRYYPSCSQYTRESVEKHGVFKGIVLGTARILRCAPYAKGGIDFPPEKFSLKMVWKTWLSFTFKREPIKEES